MSDGKSADPDPAHPDPAYPDPADRDELVVDSRGRRCPLPVIDLARVLPELPVGGVVVVLADDPAAAADIPAWCRMRGQEFLGRDQDAYRVRRTA